MSTYPPTIEALQRMTPEELVKHREEWLASLCPKQRARIAAIETRQKKRDKIRDTLITALVLRSQLADPCPTWRSEAEHRAACTDMRRRLADTQLEIERWAVRHFKLDHLSGVEQAYGIKQRKTKPYTPHTPTSKQP